MNKNQPQLHTTKWVNLTDIMMEESSQAQKNTHYDSMFIKNRKSCSRGAVIQKGLEGAFLYTYRISIKKQRGHTLLKNGNCGKMGGFPERR